MTVTSPCEQQGSDSGGSTWESTTYKQTKCLPAQPPVTRPGPRRRLGFPVVAFTGVGCRLTSPPRFKVVKNASVVPTVSGVPFRDGRARPQCGLHVDGADVLHLPSVSSPVGAAESEGRIR